MTSRPGGTDTVESLLTATTLGTNLENLRILATGETNTVRQFVEWSFADAGIELDWRGSGVAEQGFCRQTGALRVAVDPRYFRPTEVESLLGDASRAHQQLGWRAQTSFAQLVEEMVQADLDATRKYALIKQNGFSPTLAGTKNITITKSTASN